MGSHNEGQADSMGRTAVQPAEGPMYLAGSAGVRAGGSPSSSLLSSSSSTARKAPQQVSGPAPATAAHTHHKCQ